MNPPSAGFSLVAHADTSRTGAKIRAARIVLPKCEDPQLLSPSGGSDLLTVQVSRGPPDKPGIDGNRVPLDFIGQVLGYFAHGGYPRLEGLEVWIDLGFGK